jgi:hypothetical protein
VVFFTAAAGANADVNPAAGWSFDTGSGKMSCCATDAQVTW